MDARPVAARDVRHRGVVERNYVDRTRGRPEAWRRLKNEGRERKVALVRRLVVHAEDVDVALGSWRPLGLVRVSHGRRQPPRPRHRRASPVLP